MPLETQFSVPENRERANLPRTDIGEIFKGKLIAAEAGDTLPALLNTYGAKYKEAFDALRNKGREDMQSALNALAQQVPGARPAPNENDDGIRALLAANSADVLVIRADIFREIDKPIAQDKKERLITALCDSFANAGIVDLPLVNELSLRRLEDTTVANYKNLVPGSPMANKVRDGLALINGGPRTDLVKDGTPQEEVLAMYLNNVRLRNLGTLQSEIAAGRIRTPEQFAAATFANYQDFLDNPRIGIDKSQFCPSLEVYTKLCQGLGIENLLNATGRALREYAERVANIVHDASQSQRPLADFTPDTSRLGLVGLPIDLINRGMNFLGRMAPEPGHLMGADVGSLGRGLVIAMGGTTALLNAIVLGMGGFNRVKNAFGQIMGGNLKDAANEIMSIPGDIKQSLPGAGGTAVLALAFASSRFTSLQETEAWARGVFGSASTLLQQATGRDIGRDIMGLGREAADWFSATVGPYARKGKEGVISFFESGVGFAGRKVDAVRTWVEAEGYKMEDIQSYFACEGRLNSAINNQLLGAGTGIRMNNDKFNKFMAVYLPKLNAPNVDLQHPPAITFDELKTAKVLDDTNTLKDATKKDFTPDAALAQEIKNQEVTYRKYFVPPTT